VQHCYFIRNYHWSLISDYYLCTCYLYAWSIFHISWNLVIWFFMKLLLFGIHDLIKFCVFLSKLVPFPKDRNTPRPLLTDGYGHSAYLRTTRLHSGHMFYDYPVSLSYWCSINVVWSINCNTMSDELCNKSCYVNRLIYAESAVIPHFEMKTMASTSVRRPSHI
jgi:hypothetical protein